MVTRERLTELLAYDPETGIFTWKVKRRAHGGRVYPGDVAGFVRETDGYVFIGIDGKAIPAQKLAWLYITGEWPIAVVDHKNRQRSDNRFANLRAATWIDNCRNKSRRADNQSGVTGVSYDAARTRWVARIRVGDKYLMLGRFKDKEQAISARLDAEHRYFGEFAPSLIQSVAA